MLNSAVLIVPAAVAAGIAIYLIFAGPAVAIVEIVNEGTEPDDAVFRPESIAVRPGTAITWINNDASAHTATSDAFDSELLSPGEEYSFTFEGAGAFDYYCQLHPNMTGRVTVE